ncbi:hypothetical protein OS121_17280 [Mycolicibacterium mucogenicum]|uniref:hypothetical protein n=1 Tax=Mycolicibacterium mucogenicum TaxID=56689 RepID=UPI00226AC9DF|nr:hypothetical protein [Mycolicibacterium mucogenicum]MCX8556815.1 hypothetical protein [Mycolicibacterium mucogenicum]
MKKSTAATLAMALAAAVVPVVSAPTASADICAGVHGRFVGVGGCGAPIARGVEAGVAAAAIASSADPYVPGEIPCYTVEGTPYFTPPGAPC